MAYDLWGQVLDTGKAYFLKLPVAFARLPYSPFTPPSIGMLEASSVAGVSATVC